MPLRACRLYVYSLSSSRCAAGWVALALIVTTVEGRVAAILLRRPPPLQWLARQALILPMDMHLAAIASLGHFSPTAAKQIVDYALLARIRAPAGREAVPRVRLAHTAGAGKRHALRALLARIKAPAELEAVTLAQLASTALALGCLLPAVTAKRARTLVAVQLL